MELELDGDTTFEVSGEVEVTLPDYMTTLCQSELDEARTAEQRDTMIVAVGWRPGTDEIVFLTATDKFMTLKTTGHDIPQGQAIPTDWGHTIAIVGKDYEVAADWAIENAEPINLSLPTYEGEGQGR